MYDELSFHILKFKKYLAQEEQLGLDAFLF